MKFSAVTRLYVGFFTAILLVVLSGLLSYRTFQRQLQADGWVEHTYQVLDKLEAIHKLLGKMEVGRRNILSSDVSNFLHASESRAIESATDDLKVLISDNPAQLQRARQIEADASTLLDFWRTVDAEQARTGQTAVRAILKQETLLTGQIHGQLDQMIRVERALLVRRQQTDELSIERSIYELLLSTLLTLFIVFWLIYLTVREFRNNRRSEALLHTNYTELKQVNQVSHEKNWLLTGLSAVNDSLQDITDTASLTQSILHTLTNYLNLPASAFYCYVKDRQELQLIASVALPIEVKKSYRLGEGLIGQAGLARGMILTNDVPAHYWVIQAGSGHATPGQIVCMPLWYNQQLKGILELASFTPLGEQPLQLLKSTANNIAVAINAADGHAEVVNLLQMVQEQKEELSNQQEELQQSNEELLRQAEVLQVSEEELKVQEEELRETNAELQERNKIIEAARKEVSEKAKELEINSNYKSEFLANMSHELRTPLNSVLILARLLADNKQTNLTDKQIEYANIIHKSGNDLLNLINDILDLSKIEAGKVELFLEPTSVATIIRDMNELFSVVAEEKGVQLITNVDAAVPSVIRTDRQRLGQIIKNMLSNAFKFTPKGGSVTLAFRIDDRPGQTPVTTPTIAIAVTDTGIGIAPEKQQLIFEAFQQADGSTSRKFGGTGLGLSISKELIRKLGGELGLRSDPGRGSTFTVYLPVETSVDDAQPSVHTGQPVDMASPPALMAAPQPRQLSDDRHAIMPGDTVILIVEDDPIFAGIVRDFAREKNYKTIVALRGDEGMQYARQYQPSAIILDIGLPVVNGWDLLHFLKNDETLKHIPVHIISAMDESASLSDDILAYATKPVEKKDLEGILAVISKKLNGGNKRILVLSGNHLTAGSIGPLLSERQFALLCDYATSADQAKLQLSQQVYDCIIADIGQDVEQGIQDLQAIQAAILPHHIPVIIYLDKDLTTIDERQLNKISHVIIRDSFLAKNRLMDELELFFYKVRPLQQPPAEGKRVETALPDKCLPGRKVLLVDDDMRNVFALSTLLESQQMTVVTAGDGQEALDMLGHHPDTDLVLMDVMMPNMDGYEATRRIRTNQRFLKLPVIALTAKAMTGDREKCIEAGASDYITKPVDTTQLVSLMRVWLS